MVSHTLEVNDTLYCEISRRRVTSSNSKKQKSRHIGRLCKKFFYRNDLSFFQPVIACTVFVGVFNDILTGYELVRL